MELLCQDVSVEHLTLVWTEASREMLTEACRWGNAGVAKYLLSQMPSCQFLSEMALVAAERGHLETLVVLEEAGTEWSPDGELWSQILMKSCEGGHASIARHALSQWPAVLETDEVRSQMKCWMISDSLQQGEALTSACASGSAELVELLYMAKAKEADFTKIRSYRRGERVPLQVAVKSRNSEVIRTVLKYSQRIDYSVSVSRTITLHLTLTYNSGRRLCEKRSLLDQ